MNHPSDDPSTCCPTCGGDGTIDPMDDLQIGGAMADNEELLAKVKADARALWAYRVLGAVLRAGGAKLHWFADDMSASVAAQVMFPTLPAEVRATLGERP